ncbi:tetratricopeptide repeat protein [Caldicellulosiruptor changbaiensis]|uniref:Tetratricopeptide repeat protein n=1 Tax=Caldicellulosiruptor changbaiensis TaxID=1222016 RepID=A0A3T0D7Y5_9FIRM|nr:tetratricopeptide repeat protein [Caldicellulosiruptor changbaiensis]AZT91250.1 tetratricopeptide repeat protein [Caldicellulosiruptor changbaiensis]
MRRDLVLHYLESGNYKKAREVIQNILQEDPLNAEAYIQLSAIELESGNLKKAEDYAKEALKIDSNNKVAWAVLGQIYHHQKDYSQAERCYLQALKIDNVYVEVLACYSELLIETGFIEKGLEILKYAKSLEPTNDLILENEFFVNLYNRNFEKANKTIKKLFTSSGKIGSIYKLLVLYEVNRGNFKKAYNYAKLAWQEYPNDQDMLMVLEYLKMLNSPLLYFNRLFLKLPYELFYILFLGGFLLLSLIKMYILAAVWVIIFSFIYMMVFVMPSVYKFSKFVKKAFIRLFCKRKY